MRYKKVQKVAFLGNSKRSIYLRQQCAMKMLPLLKSDTVIVNLDESWLPEGDNRHKKWRLRGQTNSVKERVISPTIGMIAAIDTEGRLYLSLNQVKTD